MKLLLLSGGIDSSCIAAWLRPDMLCTVDYGQRVAAAEIRASAYVASQLGLRHEVIKVDCSALGTGHLTGREPSSLAAAPEWWPYRNQLLITLGAMRFVSEGLSEIMIGTVASDVVHMDGRAEFIDAIGTLLRVQEGAVNVSAPASLMRSEELILRSGITAELLAYTFSCHVSVYPCGQCRGCLKHNEVMSSTSAP
ncbi:MAG: 7-cyano-7-deazaguanine synthase [Rhodospirillaceae bacterium]|nr:MAG: 7-cyano-7-deazaguanine synthase [Rhodospirillaceae bacterium]